MPDCIKPKIIVYHLCQIALNQTLSCKFEKWCKISSCVEVKSHKKNLHKKIPAYAHMQQEQQKSMDATDWVLPTVHASLTIPLFLKVETLTVCPQYFHV